MFKLKLIKDQNDYQNACLHLDGLLDRDTLTLDKREEMELVAHLIEEYEEKAFPIDNPSPIAAIKFRMEQMNLNQMDLVPYIGNKSVVSNILTGKRPLTLKMIRSLNKGLKIPLEVLAQEESINYINQPLDINWEKFPIKAMFEKAREVFFPDVNASYQQIKNNVEHYLRDLIEPFTELASGKPLCRQNLRMSDRSNNYALAAWVAGCRRIADEEILNSNYKPENKSKIINQLKALTKFDSGPKLALELLQKEGIHVIILSHLPRTYLDGAVFPAKDGNPVIALTLRYDRIDNFWFTLFHELGHVFLHLNSDDDKACYLDDLEMIADIEEEKSADLFASENLIQDEYLEKASLLTNYSTEKVIDFANKYDIHPSIVAGRIRYINKNYKILWKLVGSGKVRYLFENQTNTR
ncbi:MAG: ImmA/IrrE family metallo-endopeptidase [Candidatus Stygibacter australis]|nr:ImmA/IrrE family metallo-endopeptidase [Candidatus Stygibacter australis]MDP8322983.1 ImmA/IrrE family metallo-endopeptidase [Candidatus Stygibacter australis]